MDNVWMDVTKPKTSNTPWKRAYRRDTNSMSESYVAVNINGFNN